MRIDTVLRAIPSLKIERPPEIWEVDHSAERVGGLVDAMLAVVQSAGVARDAVTLNVSNVVVEPPDDGEDQVVPAIGEYVALTVLAESDLGPDAIWHPTKNEVDGLLLRILPSLQGISGFAYVRRIPPQGSVTVFLARKNTSH